MLRILGKNAFDREGFLSGKLALSAKCYVSTGKMLLTGTVSVRKASLVCTMLYFYGKNAFDRNGSRLAFVAKTGSCQKSFSRNYVTFHRQGYFS